MNIFSHIGILVNDLNLMKDFYIKCFDMKVTWYKENEKCYLTTGGRDILGFQVDSDYKKEGKITLDEINSSVGHTPNFFHFGTVTTNKEEYLNLRSKLIDLGISVSDNKVSRDKSESFYLHDPEYNCIQICYAPNEYFQV